jgi:hypothetical protein
MARVLQGIRWGLFHQPTLAEDPVLPSSKRPARNPDASGETIRTGDFEVVHASPAHASARRRGDRRVIEPQVDDEERTLLFAGSPRTMLPPRSAEPVPMPAIAKPARAPNMNLRGLARGPEARQKDMRGAVRRPLDAEDRTVLRPTSTLPPALQPSASVAPPSPPASPAPAAARPVSARPPAMMPTPYVSMKPSAPPVEINARGGSDRKSDPPGDPPGSVITARTRIVRAKSSLPWAVALMAVGAFVGLGAAVVARGDADSVLDAAATMMDPSHASAAHAGAAAAQGTVIPSFVDTTAKETTAGDSTSTSSAPLAVRETTVTAPVVVNLPPAAHPSDATSAAKADTKVATIAGADPRETARPAPPRPAPVAYAAPVHHTWHPAPAARSESSSSSGGWLANITPAGAGAPIARPSHSKSGADSFESAAAADALAKAQLEASLR